ncbi:hypothetical protein J0X12_03220 [Sneathiella sp. CAU 1612]|uniref:Uncharacterized protein n=1 Tax=Sneathiella sedimenti TaxID=2816034 RepID=A0ABS3F283_9PROT|nr:hypothetical protein [Sneathiella sedimenti]MBO0332608.1 hypothetical protein [Sneathiella sedimenti]
MALQKHTKVFTVFSFLRLQSPDIFWYQWIYPSVIFAVAFGGFQWWGDQFISFDKDNLISDINAFMGILVGFYIAALAAVSSFSNDNLDQIMKGRAPTLTTVRKGAEIKETLTRRRFLAIIFGYSATLAIILYIFGVLQVHLIVVQPTEPWAQTIMTFIRQMTWGLYIWIASSLLVVTLLGLHYLVERMHRA